jgi:hypothetical protein
MFISVQFLIFVVNRDKTEYFCYSGFAVYSLSSTVANY